MSDPALSPPAFEPASLLGVTFDGRYVVSAHLATGGMGAVFRAQHVHLRKDVAVKVLRPDLTTSPDIVERFRREAEIASALEHDNIVRVTDFGRSESGLLFLVMELLTGESLFERLRREGFLPPETAVPILWQVCAGLEAAHALGVVHRDLKPENVFLARTAHGREVAKVLDFGIAKIADSAAGTTQAGIVVGTPEYLSPEQAMGSPIDARADVYAVGLIAWRTLAGRHPFKADDARALLMMQATRPVPALTEPRPDLAAYPELVAAVARATAKDPAARQQTVAALREELAASLGPAFMMPSGATPAPFVPLAPSPAPRRLWSAPPDDARTPDATPMLTPSLSRLGRARVGSIAAGAARRLRAQLGRLGPRAADLARRARARPLPIAAVALALAAIAGTTQLVAWSEGRAAAEAREFLAGDRAGDARTVLEDALARRPDDPELLVLRGRTLHRLGRHAAGIEAYAAARARGPLDAAAFEDLVADLGREGTIADRASKLLREEGPRSTAFVLRAAAEAPGAHRLRALALARDLGVEERLDRTAAYGDLLGDPECEIRRAAARRLGELGEPAAVPRLQKAAQAKTETKGFFGKVKLVSACGTAEAEAAARRIEAARLPPAR